MHAHLERASCWLPMTGLTVHLRDERGLFSELVAYRVLGARERAIDGGSNESKDSEDENHPQKLAFDFRHCFHLLS